MASIEPPAKRFKLANWSSVTPSCHQPSNLPDASTFVSFYATASSVAASAAAGAIQELLDRDVIEAIYLIISCSGKTFSQDTP